MKADGFDAVIGNPPYVRIQALKEWAPVEVEFYKQCYTAASKGNYDIYVVFVERVLQLLNERGRMGFILPHKFFQAKYGEPLRKLLAEGQHLGEIVHFGDQQVFAGASTYTCLLFLDSGGNDRFCFQRVRDLASWRLSSEAEEGEVKADLATKREWNFSVGPGAALFERIGGMSIKLGDVASRIFQGLITGADKVFILENLGGGLYSSWSTKQVHELESALMYPLCKGAVNLKRYEIADITKSILFPYEISQGAARLLSPEELNEQYPHAWEYLMRNRSLLEGRERGKWQRVKSWYAFGRTQNLGAMEQTKILTPSIAAQASFTLDTEDLYFVGSGGGGGGGYGITLKSEFSDEMYPLVLGLLNSRLLEWYLMQISSRFRGGYFAWSRQYIEQLPIKMADPASEAEKKRQERITQLAHSMIGLHRELQASKTGHDTEFIQRQIDATDKQIDQLVYELYGLTDKEIRIVEESMK